VYAQCVLLGMPRSRSIALEGRLMDCCHGLPLQYLKKCVNFTVHKLMIQINNFRPVFRIHDMLVWIQIRIRIRGFMPLTNGSGLGSGPQDANKKLIFFISFSAYYFLNVHKHNFQR
jgi:hypothetical protein